MRVTRGTRADVYEVNERSIKTHIERHGRLSDTKSGRSDDLAELANRVAALEAEQTDSSPDQINLVYANLRLLQIHEEYDRAMEAMLAADEHRRRALDSMRKVANEYRAAIEQFHLPPGPPPESG